MSCETEHVVEIQRIVVLDHYSKQKLSSSL